MDEFIDFNLFISEEVKTESEAIEIAKGIINLQIQIGHIPETDQIEFIQLN